jgi:hypothetical protein
MRGSSTAAPAHTAATLMATQTARRPADLAASAGPGPDSGTGRGSGASGKSAPSAARTLRPAPPAGSDAGPGRADGGPGFRRPVPSVILASQARRHGAGRSLPTRQQEPATPKAVIVVSSARSAAMASQLGTRPPARNLSRQHQDQSPSPLAQWVTSTVGVVQA